MKAPKLVVQVGDMTEIVSSDTAAKNLIRDELSYAAGYSKQPKVKVFELNPIQDTTPFLPKVRGNAQKQEVSNG